MQSSIMHRLLWGIVVVAIGVMFLLNQLGITDMNIGEMFGTFWPVFLILIGLQGMLLQHKGGFWWNGITMLLGVYFLGRNLSWFDHDLSEIIRFIGPVAIIIFGISMIFKGGKSNGRAEQDNKERWNPITPPHATSQDAPPGPPPAPPEWDEFEKDKVRETWTVPPVEPPKPPVMTEDMLNKKKPGANYGGHKHKWEYKGCNTNQDWFDPNRINHSRFIGDLHLGNDYWELRPTNISLFIGDTTLDLTKAQIPIGETKIYISSFIGDVKVYVPNDPSIGIQVSSSCLIGDVKVMDHKRGGLFNHMNVSTPSYSDADKRVVLIVSSMIGDVKVMKVG